MSRIRVFEVLECGGAGGTGNQVAALCNDLDKAQFEVTLVYAVRPGNSAADYEKSARGAEHFVHVPEMVREITPLSDLKAFRRLYGLFRERRPDVVHAHSSKAGFSARVAARLAGVPRIFYSPRGYSFLQTDRGALSRWLYRGLEKSVSWIGDVVAVGESEAALARELGAGRVRIVRDAYLGDAGENGSQGPRTGKTGVVVCGLGRLSFPRHPEAFVRLAQRLTDSRNGLRCVWIGGGELEPLAREMIRDMNLSGKLEVTGWLPHAEAIQRLRSADVLVHYSRWEGLPNSVLEAMACGLPVVASDIPGNRDLVAPGENGFLAASEAELLERTLQLVDDPRLRDKLGAGGRSLVKSGYSRRRLIDEISQVYGG